MYRHSYNEQDICNPILLHLAEPIVHTPEGIFSMAAFFFFFLGGGVFMDIGLCLNIKMHVTPSNG